MSTPNVLVRLHYYEKNSKGREFYSSNMKDDYLNYIDKGIQMTKYSDYMDYAGNEEKSSGVFSKDGLLTASQKKEIREKLRSTDSCVWDCVISFEEKYGKLNCYDHETGRELLNSMLPKFFKDCGLNPDNMIWFAGLHRNTDNRHMHLSFFEKEPQNYNKKTKSYKFHQGKLPISKVNDLKMSIEKHYLEPIEGIKRVRKLVLDKTKDVLSSSDNQYNEKVMQSLLKDLYENLPKSGSLAYNSSNMDKIRPKIDAISKLGLKIGGADKDYQSLRKQLRERDNKIRRICLAQHISNPAPYLYLPKFENDLKRRMGNIIIDEAMNLKESEEKHTRALSHPKAIIRKHQNFLVGMMLKAFSLSYQVSKEAEDSFKQWRQALRKAEHDRKVESGEIELS